MGIKISGMTPATSILTTDVLPVVISGANRKVTSKVVVNAATGANPSFSGLTIQPITGTDLSTLTLINDGGTGYIGIESSAGGSIIAGASVAYALSIRAPAGRILQLGTNNTAYVKLDLNGSLLVNATTAGSATNKFVINAYTTAVTNATVMISTSTGTDKGLVIQGVSAQSDSLFEAQNSAGTSLVSISSAGKLSCVTFAMTSGAAAGYVLVGDGSGNASWTALSGIGVTSVSNSDGTLTISPTTGAVIASLNVANANIWTARQTIRLATEQLRLGYDASIYCSVTVDSTGFTYLTPTGATPGVGLGTTAALVSSGEKLSIYCGASVAVSIYNNAAAASTLALANNASGGHAIGIYDTSGSAFSTERAKLGLDGSTVALKITGNFGVDIYYSTNKVFSVLAVAGSTRQYYDASNYASFTVNSGGDLTIVPTGGDTTITGTLTVSSSITVTGLTSGRVPFASTGGLLVDDADMTFATDTLTVTKLVGSTSVSTPSIITASGALTITPASGNAVNISATVLNMYSTTAPSGVPALYATGWGYASDTYRVIQIGSAAVASASTVAIGYDPSINPWSGFAGDGRELILRRGVNFCTPNSGNTAFYNLNMVLADGKVSIGTATMSAYMSVLGSTEQLRLSYDASNYVSHTVSSAGALTLASSSANGNKLATNMWLDVSTARDGSGNGYMNAVVMNSSGSKYGNIQVLSTAGTGAWALGYSSSLTSTLGAQVITWTGDANVGIGLGATSPSAYLAGSGGLAIYQSSTSGLAIANASLNMLWYITGSTFRLYDVTNTAERMLVNASGNFVFGATTASARVHSVSTTEQLRLGYDASNYASFTVSSVGNITIAPSGGQVLVSNGTSTVPSIAWATETTLGIYREQAGQLAIMGRLGVGRRWVPNGDPSNVVLYVGNRGTGWGGGSESDSYDLRASSANLYSFASEASMQCYGGNNTAHFSAWFQAFSFDDGSSRTLTNQYGCYIAAGQKPTVSTLTITNAYGLYIEAPTVGSSINYGIFNAGILRQQGATLFESVTIGADASSTGHLRLPNAGRIMARTVALSDRALIECDASNIVYLGDAGGWAGIQVYPGTGNFSLMSGNFAASNLITNSGAMTITPAAGSAVNIVVSGAGGRLSITGTSGEQLRPSYDASNYCSVTVASTGSTTFALTGTGPTFTFSQAAAFSATVAVTTSVSTPSLISTAAVGITPAAGNNLNVTLSGAGNLVVNTSLFVVETSDTCVGIGTATPATYMAGTAGLAIYQSASPGFAIANATNKWLWYMNSGQGLLQLYDVTAGAERLAVDTSGRFGFGTVSPSARVHSLSTSEQFRAGYDASNYMSCTVNSTGSTTFNLIGTSSTYTFTSNAASSVVMYLKDSAHSGSSSVSYLQFSDNANAGLGYVGKGSNGNSDLYIVGMSGGGVSLCSNGNGNPAAYIDTSYNTGFGVTSSIGARIHAVSTSQQLRLGYDASNYCSVTVSSTGGTTFDLTGTSPKFTFSDPVCINGVQLQSSGCYLSVSGGDAPTACFFNDSASNASINAANNNSSGYGIAIFDCSGGTYNAARAFLGLDGGTTAFKLRGNFGIDLWYSTSKVLGVTAAATVVQYYDASNYATNTVDSAGILTMTATGVAIKVTKQAYFPTATLTDAATISWDVSAAQTAKVTLGGNRTLGAPSNLKDGATYVLRVIQDGTGSRTLAYNAVFKWAGGVAPTLSTAAGAIDILTFVSDGTNMYGVATLNLS